MQNKIVTMNRVILSKPVETSNVQLDLDLYNKLDTVTRYFHIDYKYNSHGCYYNMFIKFNTTKDLLEILKLFRQDFDISFKEIKRRKL